MSDYIQCIFTFYKELQNLQSTLHIIYYIIIKCLFHSSFLILTETQQETQTR